MQRALLLSAVFLAVMFCSCTESEATRNVIVSPISVPYKFHDHIINRTPQNVTFEYTTDSIQVYYADSTKTTIYSSNQKLVLPWDSVVTTSGLKARAPSVLERVQPEFPSIAVRAQVEGKVIVTAWTNEKGITTRAAILQSGAELFNQSAIDAVMHWKFRPPTPSSGIPGVWAIIEFDYIFQSDRPTVIMPN